MKAFDGAVGDSVECASVWGGPPGDAGHRITNKRKTRFLFSGFQSSSMVEHAAVNRGVEGSSPSSGAILKALFIGLSSKKGRPLSVKLKLSGRRQDFISAISFDALALTNAILSFFCRPGQFKRVGAQNGRNIQRLVWMFGGL